MITLLFSVEMYERVPWHTSPGWSGGCPLVSPSTGSLRWPPFSSRGSIRWSTPRSRRARRCGHGGHHLGGLVEAGTSDGALGRRSTGVAGSRTLSLGVCHRCRRPRPRHQRLRPAQCRRGQGSHKSGSSTPGPPTTTPFDDLDELLGTTRPGDYVAIQAYLDPTAETDQTLPACPPGHPVPLPHGPLRSGSGRGFSTPQDSFTRGAEHRVFVQTLGGSAVAPGTGAPGGRVILEQLAQMRS